MKVRHWLSKSPLLVTALTLACGGGGIMAEPGDETPGGSQDSGSSNSNNSGVTSDGSSTDTATTNSDSGSGTTASTDASGGAGAMSSTDTSGGAGSDASAMTDNTDTTDNTDNTDTTTTDTSTDDGSGTATSDPSVPAIIDPDYPGVDVALVPEQAPTGCSAGLDLETGMLELTLDGDVPGVLLSASNGALLVNGQACTAADGTEADADNLQSLLITGNSDANFVIFDFMPGSWGNLLEDPQSVRLELDSGRNQLVVRGTAGDDALYLGTVGADTGLDWTGDGHANAIAVDLENIIVSLGPGNDVLGSMLDLEPIPLEDTEAEPLFVDMVEVRLTVWGGAGDDDLAGGYGNDWFDGGAGSDVLSGYDGSDAFADGVDIEGADVINGGSGYDEISYETRAANLNITLCRTENYRGCDETCSCDADDGEPGEGDNLINLEMVIGGTGNDLMLGTDADESFYGNEGNDELIGNKGSDLLLGQQGSDIIDGGLDEDICDDDPADVSSVGCEI